MKNRNQTDIKLSRMSKNIQLKKRAFTLIELIVVMAVIAILVLLAMPRFANYTQKARAAQIVNDIKVLENRIDEYLIRHESFPAEFIVGNTGGGQLFDRTGPIDTSPGNLKVVDRTFIPESNLDGDFFVDEGGNVVYEDDRPAASSGVVAIIPVGADNLTPLGSGSEADPYQVWFLEHLAYIGVDANTLSSEYIAMRDLDFNEDGDYINSSLNKSTWTTNAGWTPIGLSSGRFIGKFNGNNMKLSNLSINRPSTNDVGLFSYMDTGAKIENYTLLNAEITGNRYVGAIAGEGDSSESFPAFSISNVSVYGTISGASSIGGIVGFYERGEISDSYADVTISGGQDVGGIVGVAYSSTIARSSSKSVIYGTTLGAYNNGSTINVRYIGGIAGTFYGGDVIESYSSSQITGHAGTHGLDVGGLVGNFEAGTIRNSYSKVSILFPSGGNLGGLVGYSGGNIYNSYSLADIEAGSFLFAGVNEMTGMMGTLLGTHYGNVENAYSAGTVIAPVDAWAADGDIFGDDSGAAINSAQKTDSEMKLAATYDTWDSSIWNIEDGVYPTLINLN